VRPRPEGKIFLRMCWSCVYLLPAQRQVIKYFTEVERGLFCSRHAYSAQAFPDTTRTLRTIVWYNHACISNQRDNFLSPSQPPSSKGRQQNCRYRTSSELENSILEINCVTNVTTVLGEPQPQIGYLAVIKEHSDPLMSQVGRHALAPQRPKDAHSEILHPMLQSHSELWSRCDLASFFYDDISVDVFF